MKFKKLFQVLVVGGATLGLTNCGAGSSKNNTGTNSASSSTDGGTKDGGTGGVPGGGPQSW